MSDAAREEVGKIGVADDVETAAEQWETMGRELLRQRLKGTATETDAAFGEVSHKISQGKEPTKDDVEKLYAQVEELKFAVETLAESVPGSRRQGIAEHLTREELEAVGRRMDREDE